MCHGVRGTKDGNWWMARSTGINFLDEVLWAGGPPFALELLIPSTLWVPRSFRAFSERAGIENVSCAASPLRPALSTNERRDHGE